MLIVNNSCRISFALLQCDEVFLLEMHRGLLPISSGFKATGMIQGIVRIFFCMIRIVFFQFYFCTTEPAVFEKALDILILCTLFDPPSAISLAIGLLKISFALCKIWYNEWSYGGLHLSEWYPGKKCEICGRAFFAHSTFRHHQALHRGETTCRLCDRVFSQKRHLKIHIKRYHPKSELFARPDYF